MYYRVLQRNYTTWLHKIGYHRRSQQIQITLSPWSMTELRWWTSPDLTEHNKMSLHPPPIDMTITTDASTKGWVAVCLEIRTGGTSTTWNWKLHCWQFNHFSKTKHRCQGIWDCWWTTQQRTGLLRQDYASRHFNNRTEWTLSYSIFRQITTRYTPLHKWTSLRPESTISYLAIWIDIPSWSLGNSWVLAGLEPMDRIYPSTNCPDPTNSTLILQMRQDKATDLMIAPAWQGQPWTQTSWKC